MNSKTTNNFYYNKNLVPYARDLRKNMTKAEVCLWKYALKGRQRLGYQFNRQRPVLSYIADFMCKELLLIIEVDGSTHEHDMIYQIDINKEQALREVGFEIIRFQNKDVLQNMDSVIREIERTILRLKNER